MLLKYIQWFSKKRAFNHIYLTKHVMCKLYKRNELKYTIQCKYLILRLIDFYAIYIYDNWKYIFKVYGTMMEIKD